MKLQKPPLTILLVTLAGTSVVGSTMTAYVDEALFLTDLASLGFAAVHEGFEDDTAWGSVRSTVAGGFHTAPSISNLGVTWTSNNPISEVTTGSGAARTGDWGFYTLPHGDQPAIGDGFRGTSSTTMFGVGGYIRTNTPPAGIALFLDEGLAGERQVDFEGANGLSTGHSFFGVIDTQGFTRFNYLETEHDFDELKFIFADDFTFGRPVPEPATLIALGLGVAPLLRRRRRP